MTTQTTNLTTPIARSIRDRIDAFFSIMGQGLNAYMESRSRLPQIEALNHKSDAELAAMGLKRDDIVRHVFRDLLYI